MGGYSLILIMSTGAAIFLICWSIFLAMVLTYYLMRLMQALLYCSAWLILALINWVLEKIAGPSPVQRTQPELCWFDLEQMLDIFHPKFPALAGPAGRAFLRAVLRPLVGNYQLLRGMNNLQGVEARRLGDLLEALQYWVLQDGYRRLERWRGWRGSGYFKDYFDALIRYLYEQHPVPPAVRSLWWNYRDAKLPLVPGVVAGHPAEALQFYFYLTRGGGLHKAPFLRWELSRTAVRYFYEAPANLGVQAAYWYALFRTEGVSADQLAQISRWPSGYGHSAFWRDLIRLWVRDGAADSPRMLGLVINQIEWLKFGIPHEVYLNHPAFEAWYGAEPDFSLRGRSWASLLRYLDDRLGMREFPLPRGMQETYRLAGPDGNVYLLVFISNTQGLISEGELLAHCVGGSMYAEMARDGAYSFWSLRHSGPVGRQKRLLTVQLFQGQIDEVGGLANREPTPEEWLMLTNWQQQLVKQVVASFA